MYVKRKKNHRLEETKDRKNKKVLNEMWGSKKNLKIRRDIECRVMREQSYQRAEKNDLTRIYEERNDISKEQMRKNLNTKKIGEKKKLS